MGAQGRCFVDCGAHGVVDGTGGQIVALLGQCARNIARAVGQHAVGRSNGGHQRRGFGDAINAEIPGEHAVHETEIQLDGHGFRIGRRQQVGAHSSQIPVAIPVATFAVFPGAAPEHRGEHQRRRIRGVVADGTADPTAQVAIPQAGQGAVAGVEMIDAGA